MRREPKKPYIIDRIIPLFFWHKCDLCESEFKYEYGWKIRYSTTSRILCNKCAEYSWNVEDFVLIWGESGCDKPSVRIGK